MDYLTADQVRDWAQDQPNEAYYCEYCLTQLVQTDEGLWYCPNEMCLNEEQATIDEEEEQFVYPKIGGIYKAIFVANG